MRVENPDAPPPRFVIVQLRPDAFLVAEITPNDYGGATLVIARPGEFASLVGALEEIARSDGMSVGSRRRLRLVERLRM